MPESPKKRFIKSPHANKVAELSLDPAVLAAFDAAILQMSWEFGAAPAVEQLASARHWQLTGAHKLRDTFLQIGIPDKELPRMRTDNLPNQV
jgi:hypothetical protein